LNIYSNIELTDTRSTIFFFTEVDDPIFYPIIHLVFLALTDGVFEAPSLATPRRIFEYKVWSPVLYIPLYWKQERLKTPIFRRDKGSTNPLLERALLYSQFKYSLNRLGLIAGFKETLTSYCFRYRIANVINCKLSCSRSRRRRPY
jgi:hypothetical protein